MTFNFIRWVYGFFVIIQLVLRGLSTHYTIAIYKSFANADRDNDDIVNLVQLFIIIESLYHIIDLFINPFLVIKIAYQAQRNFEAREFIRYNQLTFETKKRINTMMFWNMMSKAGIATYDIIAWSANAIVDTIGSLISVVYVFIVEDLMILFVGLLAGWLLVYWLTIRPWQATFTIASSRAKDIMNESYTKLLLNLYPFQYKERSPSYMIALRVRENGNSEFIDVGWQKAVTATAAITKVAIYIIIGLSPSSFMLLIYVLSQLESVLVYVARVRLRFMKMYMDLEKYNEMFSTLKNETGVDVEKLDLPPNGLTITGCSICRENFAVTLASGDSIPILIGDRILIQGASGHGKTTFVDGLCGKIDGVTLNVGNPANYYHLVADMYQNIREKMPSSTTTIRDYFKDEEQDDLIIKCMLVAFMPSELAFIQKMLPKNNLSWLDSEIDERFSGGQKSRLCVATRIYELEKNNKKILIMDEAEQGSDYENIQYMMSNIFNIYNVQKRIIIIMITHMHPVQLQELEQVGVSFNTKITITDGHIRLKS